MVVDTCIVYIVPIYLCGIMLGFVTIVSDLLRCDKRSKGKEDKPKQTNTITTDCL